MSDLLQILVTAVHLTAVNAAFGGPILALWVFWRTRRGDDEVGKQIGQSLLRGSLHGFYAGMALGVPAAWLWWAAHEREVTRAFQSLPLSRYYFAAAELLFSAACFEAWLALWRRGSKRRALTIALALAWVTNTIYHFHTLFAIVSVLSTRTPVADAQVRFVTLLFDPEVVARVTHFALASLAVSGAMLAALAVSRIPSCTEGDGPDAAAAAAKVLQTRGALTALVATLLQWPVGIFVMLELPEPARDALMGYNAGTTTLFALSLFGVLILMHRLVAAGFGNVTPAEMRSLLLWLGVTIMLMTAVRHYSREPLYLTEQASSSNSYCSVFSSTSSHLANIQ